MTELEQQLASAQALGDTLLSMPQDDADRIIREIKAKAEAASPFKKGQLVRVCRSPGLSLVGGLKHLPHDHNDPKQHSKGRVLGWDTFGRLMIGDGIGDNPHVCHYWTTDDCVQALDEEDWVQYTKYKPGDNVYFIWELYGFTLMDHWPMGSEVPAQLITPHLDCGDWYVTYQRDPTGRSWIRRVLNERQMRRA